MGQVAPDAGLNVVTVVGFEPLFEPATESFEPVSETVTITDAETVTAAPAIEVTVTSTVPTWSLKTAAEKLGVSANTIRKRIKDGELQACKVEGANGPEWRISPPTDTLTTTPSESATVTITPAIETLLKVIESQAKQLDAISDQVKAASQVIMYQRSQLEERDSAIKLLTDGQHKSGWWSKLKAWLNR
jgi:excisionase family DNA binding protein